MDKEKFCSLMNRLRYLEEIDLQRFKAFNKYGITFEDPLKNDLFELAIDMLAASVNDFEDWVTYFIYELDFGREPKSVLLDGKEYELKTPEQLYDLIQILSDREENA